MDITVLATTVVSLLVPYLAKASEGLAEKAGETAWKTLESIYNTIKEKLEDDDHARQTMERFEEKSDSEARQKALEGVLMELIENHTELAETLQKLVDSIGEESTDVIRQSVKVSDNAQTGPITQIGKVEGDVDLSQKK